MSSATPELQVPILKKLSSKNFVLTVQVTSFHTKEEGRSGTPLAIYFMNHILYVLSFGFP